MNKWGSDNVIPIPLPYRNAQPALAQSRTRAFIKVQDGCRNSMFFLYCHQSKRGCAPRSVREIIEEVDAFAKSAIKRWSLTGVHLGGYGSDLHSSLLDGTNSSQQYFCS